MRRQDRKAAIATYKERKPARGVYAIICTATGEAWVGMSRHVDTRQNGLWFMLRTGECRHSSLQAAWSLHGESAFRYEELERLRDDFPDFAVHDELKARRELWRARLQAEEL